MSVQENRSTRPFQFGLVTAFILMLVIGVGGGLWLRRQHRFAQRDQLRVQKMAKLTTLMEEQGAATSEIIDRFRDEIALGANGGSSKYGPSKRSSQAEVSWRVRLEFDNESGEILRISASSQHSLEEVNPIRIETYSIPKHTDRVEQCVAELEAEYKRRKWPYQRAASGE